MIVMKFGGSSLATPERVRQVCSLVNRARTQEHAVAVVCSAFGGATNLLIEMSRLAAARDETFRELSQIFKQRHRDALTILVPQRGRSTIENLVNKLLDDLDDMLHGVYLVREISPRTQDYIMGMGERLCALIVAETLKAELPDTEFLDARLLIRTDAAFGKARVDSETSHELIKEWFANHSGLQVVTGFIASCESGQTTTLGRGGSDYTAAIFAAALNCREVQIWTDVDGVLTADPRKVPNAFCIPEITYEEAMEMSHFGAKVIYPPTMAPAMNAGIPLLIKNTFNPEHHGTRVSREVGQHPYTICGITSIDNVSLLQLKGSGLIGVEGVSSRVFGALAQRGVNVILISQASSEYSICVAVAPDAAERARAAINEAFRYEMLLNRIEPVQVENELSVVALVGEGMRRVPGLAGKVFSSLGQQGINIMAIAQGSSECNVSLVVRRDQEQRAINVIHDAFFGEEGLAHVFLIGTGLIGKELLQQIEAGAAAIKERFKRRIVIVGVANSRHMCDELEGLKQCEILARLDAAETPLDLDVVLDRLRHRSAPILVDCTASDSVTEIYEQALNQGISVVTPNKRANSGEIARFRRLQELGSGPKAFFCYETNVGAGLPVIGPLKNLVASGDRVLRIEAMLSGTLSYLFNTFSSTVSFSQAVSIARDRGFTEPDPRDDLNGMDVARKLLILARECGLALELSELEVENLIPENCREAASVAEFLALLPTADARFQALLKQAESAGKRLRYIARLENGKGVVALQAVAADHPCFDVSGNDNLVSITSERYAQPLVVKGPGAGAAVTAAGVYAELIQVARYKGN